MQMLAEIGWGILLIVLLLASLTMVWIYAFVHCWTRNDLTFGQKIAWTIVLLFLHTLGMIIYFACSSGGSRRSSGFYPKAADPVTGRPINLDK
jgi:hypothetical protein